MPVSPSHLLLTTTDRRMAKTRQLAHGAAVAWLFPSLVQVRLEGRAILYPAPIPFPDPSPTTPEQDAAALAASFPEGSAESSPQWWEAKRRDMFESLSPELRASFCRPKPGAELKDDPAEWVDELPADAAGADAKTQAALARAWDNFAVLALQPESVEVLDLGAKPHTRTQWTSATDAPRKTDLVP